MAFKFKMQKILDYRAQLEEEAKVRLADAQAKHDACRRQLEEIDEELEAAQKKAAAEALQPADFWLHDHYIRGLKADHKMMAMQERLLAQMAEEARRHLAECAIDRKVLEKLSDKQKVQYYRAEQKQELNFNDEIATIRHKTAALQTD